MILQLLEARIGTLQGVQGVTGQAGGGAVEEAGAGEAGEGAGGQGQEALVAQGAPGLSGAGGGDGKEKSPHWLGRAQKASWRKPGRPSQHLSSPHHPSASDQESCGDKSTFIYELYNSQHLTEHFGMPCLLLVVLTLTATL